MERDQDEPELIPSDAKEPGQDIVSEMQREDDALRLDAPDWSNPSSESQMPSVSLAPHEAPPSAKNPARSEEFLEVPTLVGAAAAQSGGHVTRIEFSPELEISSALPTNVSDRGRGHLLPLEPGAKSESDSDPVDQIFPPAWRLPADSGGSFHAPESAAGETPESLGKTIPRLQVFVTLLESRTMVAEAIEEAVEKHAPQFREIAKSEVERGFWDYMIERRAADWRLR